MDRLSDIEAFLAIAGRHAGLEIELKTSKERAENALKWTVGALCLFFEAGRRRSASGSISNTLFVTAKNKPSRH